MKIFKQFSDSFQISTFANTYLNFLQFNSKWRNSVEYFSRQSKVSSFHGTIFIDRVIQKTIRCGKAAILLLDASASFHMLRRYSRCLSPSIISLQSMFNICQDVLVLQTLRMLINRSKSGCKPKRFASNNSNIISLLAFDFDKMSDIISSRPDKFISITH